MGDCYCPCGFSMPSQTAAAACARECDDSDREARDAARRASRRLSRRALVYDPDDN